MHDMIRKEDQVPEIAPPVAPQEEEQTGVDPTITDEFGENLPTPIETGRRGGENNFLLQEILHNPGLVQNYRQAAQARIAHCTTRKEALEIEADVLAECMAIAAEIYQQFPIPDNAYQLASLTNAHNSTLSQLDRTRDPKVIVKDVEKLIKDMFTVVIRSLTLEVDKAKKDFIKAHPEDRSSVEEVFNRMFAAVAPESQQLYDKLQESLKKILGIKK